MASCLERIHHDQDGFRLVLEEVNWLLAPREDLPAWESWFEQLFHSHSETLTEENKALLLAARVVLRKQMGDDFRAIELSRDLRLVSLTNSVLRKNLQGVVIRLADTYGCNGILWPLRWLQDGDRSQVAIKATYYKELATAWLLDQARRIVQEGKPEIDVRREMLGTPVIYGIGSAPAEPPGWLSPTEEDVRAQFSRLRGFCPGEDDLRREFADSYRLSIDPLGQAKPGSEEQLLASVHAADLLGEPEFQVISRTALAGYVARSEGTSHRRYRSSSRSCASPGPSPTGSPGKRCEYTSGLPPC